LEIILKYFPNLTQQQKVQLEKLEGLYQEWNSKINVISRKDMDHFYERHVLHSLGVSKVKVFKEDQKVLDVGTGGGFPGIPLAILFPSTQFHLVDSIGKKIKIVNEVAKELELTNVIGEHSRAEDLKSSYHFVISRAVTRLKPFYGWVRTKIIKSKEGQETGILYLKGGSLEEELAEVPVGKEIYDLKDFFDEEFFETKKLIYIPF
jgi:16S rRNA (guanine527-N7)-methyltransferase